jgi:hypothetical protein
MSGSWPLLLVALLGSVCGTDQKREGAGVSKQDAGVAGAPVDDGGVSKQPSIHFIPRGATEDPDEFDDSVLLHEFTHYIYYDLSLTFSTVGGVCPRPFNLAVFHSTRH